MCDLCSPGRCDPDGNGVLLRLVSSLGIPVSATSSDCGGLLVLVIDASVGARDGQSEFMVAVGNRVPDLFDFRYNLGYTSLSMICSRTKMP